LTQQISHTIVKIFFHCAYEESSVDFTHHPTVTQSCLIICMTEIPHYIILRKRLFIQKMDDV